MINPVDVEEFLVQLLSDKVAPIPVDPFPNISDIEEYKEHVNSAIGAVTIAVRRIQKVPATERRGEFAFFVQILIFRSNLRSFTGHQGVYETIRTITEHVDEKRFNIAGEPVNSMVDNIEFLEQGDDLFVYGMDVIILPKLARIA